MSAEDPRLLPAIDLVRRTGGIEFQLRFQSDQEPTVWIAVVGHSLNAHGHPTEGEVNRWSTAAGLTPPAAVFALLDNLIDGGTCAHCLRPSGFAPTIEQMPADQLLCWTQWDPELATFRRGCA